MQGMSRKYCFFVRPNSMHGNVAKACRTGVHNAVERTKQMPSGRMDGLVHFAILSIRLPWASPTWQTRLWHFRFFNSTSQMMATITLLLRPACVIFVPSLQSSNVLLRHCDGHNALGKRGKRASNIQSFTVAQTLQDCACL